jgi:hypothetical protein
LLTLALTLALDKTACISALQTAGQGWAWGKGDFEAGYKKITKYSESSDLSFLHLRFTLPPYPTLAYTLATCSKPSP